MIFTTRALKVELETFNEPLEAFTEHQLTAQGKTAYRRKQYFIRYIGSDWLEKDYTEELIKLVGGIKQRFPFLYLTELSNQISYGDSAKYGVIYENWRRASEQPLSEVFKVGFPFHFQSDRMELTQKVAFGEIMKQYKKISPHSSESMEKNFGIKLLYWSGHYLPQIYGAEEISLPKIIFAGSIKRQELLFLYYLNQLGCDVLYMNPKEDVSGLYPECETFSMPYRGKYQYSLELPKVLNGELENSQVNQELDSGSPIGQEELPNTGVNSSRRGSIHLGGQRTIIPHQGNQQTSYYTSSNVGVQGGVQGNTQTHIQPNIQANIQYPNHSSTQPIGSVMGDSNHNVYTTNTRRELSYEELAKLATSVVMIEVKDQVGRSYASGSGVIINHEGYILTNFHVVRGGSIFGIKFEGESQLYETSRIIKYHQDYDLAIIKVEKVCRSLPIYRGGQVVRGQKVVAIGSPLGLFNSVSDGIIAGFREFKFKKMIQFTAPISHGSSGGALLNMYGEVIGISTAGFDDGQNLNLAVDYETIQRFAGSYLY